MITHRDKGSDGEMARLSNRIGRIGYRISQFWQGLRATIEPEELARVAKLLPPAAFPLFAQMPRDAQRHSLNVLQGVHTAGYSDADLAIAALLHDCGKVAAVQGGVALGLWLRGPLVVMDAILPTLAERLAAPEPTSGWRYTLYVQREHPAIGAIWAAEAGCSALSCWLIANHQAVAAHVDVSQIAQGELARQLLLALQQADNGN